MRIIITCLLFMLGCSTAAPSAGSKEPSTEPAAPPAEPTALPAGMVAVPAGPFFMGADDALIARELELCRRHATRPEACTEERLAHERPLREMTLPDFAIDTHEVTNAEYERCVAAGACRQRDLAHCELLDDSEDMSTILGDRHPAVCVSAADAEAACRFAGKRLPTEAEWEKAARGPGAPRLFPWGDDWDPRAANARDDGATDGHALSAPVGSFPAGVSPYGAHDLAGNAWEWTASPYDAERRVTRGGGFVANPIGLTTGHRAPQRAERTTVNIGFRCAR